MFYYWFRSKDTSRLPLHDDANALTSNSSLGEQIKCDPYFVGNSGAYSAASISYKPPENQGEYNDTSVVIKRTVIPCDVNNSPKDSVK